MPPSQANVALLQEQEGQLSPALGAGAKGRDRRARSRRQQEAESVEAQRWRELPHLVSLCPHPDRALRWLCRMKYGICSLAQ